MSSPFANITGVPAGNPAPACCHNCSIDELIAITHLRPGCELPVTEWGLQMYAASMLWALGFVFLFNVALIILLKLDWGKRFGTSEWAENTIKVGLEFALLGTNVMMGLFLLSGLLVGAWAL